MLSPRLGIGGDKPTPISDLEGLRQTLVAKTRNNVLPAVILRDRSIHNPPGDVAGSVEATRNVFPEEVRLCPGLREGFWWVDRDKQGIPTQRPASRSTESRKCFFLPMRRLQGGQTYRADGEC